MRSLLLLISLLFVLTGCKIEDDATRAYIAFIDEYGTDIRYYCHEDIGFLMIESIDPDDEVSTIVMVVNDNNDPIECDKSLTNTL